ncbi:MAG: hypothetical protein ACTHXF_11770 [Brevibacterium yomogidense]
MSVDDSVPERQGRAEPTGPEGLPNEALEQNKGALDAGLRRLEDRFSEHMVCEYEDPLDFDGGYFVLNPTQGSSPRFVIEEHYTGTDDEQLPTSWSWEWQITGLHPDGTYQWWTAAHGEAASSQYSELLGVAEQWATTVRALAEREAELLPDTITTDPVRPSGQDRTL